jgi:hypothetical protein
VKTLALFAALAPLVFAAPKTPAGDSAPASVLVVSVGEVATGKFIADADVRLPSLNRSTRTRWDGEAHFAGLSNGRYRVQVRAVGFAPGDIEVEVAGDTMAVHFELERLPTALDTVRVDAAKPNLHMEAFETRRREGIGRFLTHAQLVDDRTQSLQWVLSTRFPGIQVKEKGIISMQPSGLAGDNECPVLLYLDGMQLEKVSRKPLEVPRIGGGRAGSGIVGSVANPEERRIADLDGIRPDELAGVEVYSRTSAPQQYRPLGNYCKVVLLWTQLALPRP